MKFSDMLKVAQNIAARGGMTEVDLHSELSRSIALLNGLEAEAGMAQPSMSQNVQNPSVGAPIMPQEGESTTPTEIMAPTI